MTRRQHVDLNADMGESFGRWTLGDDAQLLAVVTSANIACGFHAGDAATVVATCRAAVQRAVAIGAQVGYQDLGGFGRRFIDIEPDDLYAEVLYQVSALDGIARSVGGSVAYVKPHGALYHAVVHHREQAGAVVAAVRDHAADLAVLGLPGSALLEAAAGQGLRVVTEAFADRAYAPDGRLVSRKEPGAVLSDPATVALRVVRLVTEGRITAVDGTDIELDAESICVHGDSPDATAMASAVRSALDAAGIRLAAFSG